MSRAEIDTAGIDLDESPFERVPISGLPLEKEERRTLDEAIARIDAARAKVGPGKYAYTDDSPFGIPPRD